MSTSVVDIHIYRQGQNSERLTCEEEVLDKDFALWWNYARLVPGYLPADALALGSIVPRHRNRWDRIGLDHTDPAKVANALQTAHEAGHITDRDVQEGYYNRSVEDWQEDIREQIAFRDEVGMPMGIPQLGGAPQNQNEPAAADAGDGEGN